MALKEKAVAKAKVNNLYVHYPQKFEIINFSNIVVHKILSHENSYLTIPSSSNKTECFSYKVNGRMCTAMHLKEG